MTAEDAIQLIAEFTSLMHGIVASVGAGHLPEQQQKDLERQFKELGSARDRLVRALREP